MHDLGQYLKKCQENRTKNQSDFLFATAYGKISGDEKTDAKFGDEQAKKFYQLLNKTDNEELLEVIGCATTMALWFDRPGVADILEGKRGNYPVIQQFHDLGRGGADKIAKQSFCSA